MRRTMLALVVALSIALTVRAEPAKAVSCPMLEYQLPKLDTVVDGRIKEIQANGTVRLDVMTYYKGAGSPSLDAEVVGLGEGGRMDWSRTPRRGDRVLIGFVNQDQRLRNDICQLLIILQPHEAIPDHVQSLLPPGRPTGIEHSSGGLRLWSLLGGLLLVGGITTWYLCRRNPP
jgi:hypothetical protein